MDPHEGGHAEYEAMLLRKMSESLNQLDLLKCHGLVEEALINTGFANLGKFDNRVAKDILKEIHTTVQQYLDLEKHES